MVKATSRVKMNHAKIKQLTRAQITALEKTGEYLHTEVIQAQVMPFDTGNMQNESTFVDNSSSSRGKVSLATDTPYGRRMYFHPEYRFQTKENPNARGEWYEDWMPGGKKAEDVRKAYKQFYRREGGL